MTAYTVHLVDPHRSAFIVNPYTSNGLRFPTLDALESGASSANTSLLWYGKGSPNYGERVQENVLHLLEHFAGPTAPANPVAGQLWFDRRIFFHTAVANNDGWYVWQDLPANPNGGTWNRIPSGVAVMPTGSGAPVAAPTGGYDGVGGVGGKFQWYLDTATSPPTLYQGIFEVGHPLHQTWAICGYMEDTSVGVSPSAATYKPQQRLMVQTFGRSSQTDAANWAYANGVWASPVQPVNPVDGTLWYDTATQALKVYNSAGSPPGFEAVVGAFLPTAGGTMSGQIDMGYNRIVNLGAPILSTDATTKAYVDAQLSGSIQLNQLTDVTLTAPSARQFIVTNGGSPIVWINDNIQLSDIFGVTATLVEVNYLGGVAGPIQTQIDGKLSLTGGTMLGDIAMGTFKVTGLGTPTLGTDATNKTYVDGRDISSGSFDSGTGTLTLTRGDASTVTISGFITGTSITYNALPSELLGQLPPAIVPTNLDEAVHNLDNIVRRRTTPRRSVQTGIGGSPPQLIYTTPRYEVESFKLMVFVDGIKYVASQRGYQSVLFDTMVLGSPIGGPMQLSCDVDPVLTGGIGSPQYDYEFDVVVDGGAPQTIVINGGTNEADTFCSVVDTINQQLVGAQAILEDQAITIYSNSVGVGSSIAITDGTLGSPIFPLFATMAYYDSIDAAVPGADYDYDEVGFPGGLSTSVAFLAPVTGMTLEFIVIGQNGTTV
jgi:hypothetical protein